MGNRSSRLRERALSTPGLASVVREELPGSDRQFELHYARTRPSDESTISLLVIPGGPGLASLIGYESFRRRAQWRGLDVIMVEHRGVGLSRFTVGGDVLSREAMRIRLVIDDLAAVLDAENVESAIVVGSSYGSYLAQSFAAAHSDRVDSLILDSAMFDIGEVDPAVTAVREVLGDVDHPDTTLARLAGKIADLADDGEVPRDVLFTHARIVYEAAGPEILDRYINQLHQGLALGTRRFLESVSKADFEKSIPYFFEFDPVGEIAFRELNFAAAGADYRTVGEKFSEFVGAPYDLPTRASEFAGEVTVISGERDLRTPRSGAERIEESYPYGRLIPVPDHGHSALDTHSEVLLTVMDMHARGLAGELSSSEAAWTSLPRRGGPSRHLPNLIRASLLWDRLRR